jgi:hypothetical protein
MKPAVTIAGAGRRASGDFVGRCLVKYYSMYAGVGLFMLLT